MNNDQSLFEEIFYSKFGLGVASLVLPIWIYGDISTGETFSLNSPGNLGSNISMSDNPGYFWLHIFVMFSVWTVCFYKFIKKCSEKNK